MGTLSTPSSSSQPPFHVRPTKRTQKLYLLHLALAQPSPSVPPFAARPPYLHRPFAAPSLSTSAEPAEPGGGDGPLQELRAEGGEPLAGGVGVTGTDPPGLERRGAALNEKGGHWRGRR